MTTNYSAIGNEFFLSEEDYYRKRANLIEELKKCSIEIYYGNGRNSVEKNNRIVKGTQKYDINIQSPEDPNIDKKTAVYHELSHVLWDSFVSGSFKLLREWAQEYTDVLINDKTIPEPIRLEIGSVKERVKSYIRSVYYNCFNSLEDQRIESLTKNVWFATGGMFKNVTTNCGKEMTEESMVTPSDHLLAPRFHRPELTTAVYRKAVRDVEGTGMYGAIAVMKTIKDTIDEHIKENLEDLLDQIEASSKAICNLPAPIDLINEYIENQNTNQTIEGKSKEYKSRVQRFEEAVKNSTEHSEEQKKSMQEKAQKYKQYAVTKQPVAKTKEQENIQKGAKSIEEAKELIKKENIELGGKEEVENRPAKLKQNSHFLEEEDIDEDELEECSNITLEEAQEKGTEEVSNMLEKIYGQAVPQEPAWIVENVERTTNQKAVPDIAASQQLARTFKRVQETKRSMIQENGTELDIESLIQAHAKGYGDYMIDDIKHRGLTVYVSIDGSGSMHYDNHMDKARNLVATMFKSVESIPQVKMLANVWSSNTDGEVGITTIKNLKECNRINLEKGRGFMYTPTHEAIRYTAKQLSALRGKKLMILLTDGHPQYHRNGTSFNQKTIVERCMKEYRKAQIHCRNIMCINVDNTNSNARDNLTAIFKKNYVEFEGMDKAREFVMKEFRRTVLQVLRK